MSVVLVNLVSTNTEKLHVEGGLPYQFYNLSLFEVVYVPQHLYTTGGQLVCVGTDILNPNNSYPGTYLNPKMKSGENLTPKKLSLKFIPKIYPGINRFSFLQDSNHASLKLKQDEFEQSYPMTLFNMNHSKSVFCAGRYF